MSIVLTPVLCDVTDSALSISSEKPYAGRDNKALISYSKKIHLFILHPLGTNLPLGFVQCEYS